MNDIQSHWPEHAALPSTNHKILKFSLVHPAPPGLRPPLLTHLWSPGNIKPRQHAADQSVVKATSAVTVTLWLTEYFTGDNINSSVN